MKPMNIFLDPPKDIEAVLRSIGLNEVIMLIVDLFAWFKDSPDPDEEIIFSAGYYCGMVFSNGIDSAVYDVLENSNNPKDLLALGKFMGAYWMQALKSSESIPQAQINLNVARKMFKRLRTLDMEGDCFNEILGAVLAPLFYGRQLWPHEEFNNMRLVLLGIAEELRIRGLHLRMVQGIEQGFSL